MSATTIARLRYVLADYFEPAPVDLADIAELFCIERAEAAD